MSLVVERVARAIAAKMNTFATPKQLMHWESVEPCARAAIEALAANVTDEMLIAQERADCGDADADMLARDKPELNLRRPNFAAAIRAALA